MQRFRAAMAALAFLLLTAGAACRTDYTDDAVEKARAYALERTKDLTEPQRNFIRYATPEIWEDEIFPYQPMAFEEYAHLPRNLQDKEPVKAPYHDFMASSFVWNPPGLGYSVVVIGSGERSMQFWEPLKLVYKTTVPVDKAYENARQTAVMYVMNNMLYLSEAELNRVRFSEAEVVRTDFNMKYMQKRDNIDDSAWESYLKSLSQDTGKIQYSLIWKGDDSDHFIVITGFGGETLAGWYPMSGMYLDKAHLDRFIVKNAPVSDNKEKDLTAGNGEEKAAPPAEKTETEKK